MPPLSSYYNLYVCLSFSLPICASTLSSTYLCLSFWHSFPSRNSRISIPPQKKNKNKTQNQKNYCFLSSSILFANLPDYFVGLFKGLSVFKFLLLYSFSFMIIFSLLLLFFSFYFLQVYFSIFAVFLSKLSCALIFSFYLFLIFSFNSTALLGIPRIWFKMYLLFGFKYFLNYIMILPLTQALFRNASNFFPKERVLYIYIYLLILTLFHCYRRRYLYTTYSLTCVEICFNWKYLWVHGHWVIYNHNMQIHYFRLPIYPILYLLSLYFLLSLYHFGSKWPPAFSHSIFPSNFKVFFFSQF